jgi:hypothetical protein
MPPAKAKAAATGVKVFIRFSFYSTFGVSVRAMTTVCQDGVKEPCGNYLDFN